MKTLILFHADFQFYTVSCRIWNPQKNVNHILCLLGALHYEMSICDCLWKIFNKFFLGYINVILKLKCPDKFSSSKYPRFKKLVIITILSVKKILAKLDLHFCNLDNISNYQLKVLLLFDYLGNLFGSYITNVRNNNFGEVLKLYEVFQGLFWVLHKTNYNIGNFEQRIHFKLMVNEVFDWMKKNRFLTFRFDDSHIGYEKLIEIFNCVIKNEIHIKGHDEETLGEWLNLVQILFYVIFNERKEFVHYCRNKRRSTPSAKSHISKKWIIEKQVEQLVNLIWKYLTRKWENGIVKKEVLLKHVCQHALFEYVTLNPRFDPVVLFTKFQNFENTKNWKVWCKKNVDAFNKNFTCFKEPSTPQNNIHDDDDDEVHPTLIDELFDRKEYLKNLEDDAEYEDSDEEDEQEQEDVDFQ